MKTLQFTSEEILTIDQILAAIIHLGNVHFVSNTNETIAIDSKSKQSVKQVAYLLSIKLEQLEKTLCSRTITANREIMHKDHDISQAETGRDAFAKAIYERLFDKVVQDVNRALMIDHNANPNYQQTLHSRQCAVIGVLDIYGFEVLEQNSFEQFCINYCNERLQQLFIGLVLKQEQEEYAREGIGWVYIDYFDNAPICSLMDNSKMGIFATMDDSCLAVGTINDQLLLEAMDKKYKDNKYYDSRRKSPADKTLEHDKYFRIKHYAGPVTYDIKDFIEKNRDTLFQDFKRLLFSSQNKVISGKIFLIYLSKIKINVFIF